MKNHFKYKALLVLAVFAAVFVFSACESDNPPKEEMKTESMDTEKVFTLDELSKFDGKNGSPAYVAVDGVVYDVTDKPLWSGGTHNGNMAGMDLSEAINESPHGKAKLEELPVVGKLAEE